MSEVLSQAQTYIQLEAMKTSSNNSAKPGNHGGKLKSLHEAFARAEDWNRGQSDYKRQALSILSPSPLRAYKPIEQFTPLRLPINKVQHHQVSTLYKAFKTHPARSLTF